MIKNLVAFGYFLIVVQAQSEIVLKYLSLSRENLTISEACDRDLQLISASIKSQEVWTEKFLDASGRPDSGFVMGNNMWLGSRESCTFLNKPIKFYPAIKRERLSYPNVIEIASPLSVEYRVIYLRHMSKIQLDINSYIDKRILHVGLCFPSSCNDQDSINMSREIFKKKKMPEYPLLGNLELISSKSVKLRNDFFWQPFIVALMVFLAIVIILNILGTFYTVNHPKDVKENSLPTSVEVKKQGSYGKFISTFSIMENSKLIFSKKIGKNSIKSLYGIRALSITIIIGVHLSSYGYDALDNTVASYMYTTYAVMIVPWLTAHFTVDSFLIISGFLLSLSFFESLKKQPLKDYSNHFFKSIYNRYIRLTPIYVLVMIIAGSLSTYLNDTSPFWQTDKNEDNCKLYWWRNLLYIQNWWTMSDMCMSWTWYLSTDFQLSIMGSFLHVVYLWSQNLCIALSAVLALVSAGYCGYIGTINGFGFSVDNHLIFIDNLYIKTYARVGVYLVGFWAAWYFSKINRELKMTQKQKVSLWILSLAILYGLLLSHFVQEGSYTFGGLFPAFGRTLWALAMAYLIIACATGNGGIIARILNADFFLPFSRISYSSYLMHPLIYLLVILSCDKPLHFDLYNGLIIQGGFIMATYIVAFVFSVMVEFPVSKIISSISIR